MCYTLFLIVTDCRVSAFVLTFGSFSAAKMRVQSERKGVSQLVGGRLIMCRADLPGICRETSGGCVHTEDQVPSVTCSQPKALGLHNIWRDMLRFLVVSKGCCRRARLRHIPLRFSVGWYRRTHETMNGKASCLPLFS